MKDKFICNCDFDYIDIDTRPIKNLAYIGMTIYEHRSKNTGNLFKKPKEVGTVTLIGKEALQFKAAVLKMNGKAS